MQNQRIQTPSLTPDSPLNSFFPSKSKELTSVSTMINKCLKIITLLSSSSKYVPHPYFNHGSMHKDPLESLSYLIDKILQLSSKCLQGQHQSQQMQNQLQKQQNLNRILIKKQLQYREEQKMLLDQLNTEKNKNTKLQEYIGKLNDEIKDKDLAILHVKNQLKASQKQRLIMDPNDLKIQFPREYKLKSYVSKDLTDREASKKVGIHKLGHKRRKSQDITKLLAKQKKSDTKKKSSNVLSSHKVNGSK